MKWEKKKETLNLFNSTIYIEDEFTHKNYNCLGNRFYESIFCNSIPFFDKSCLNTLKYSGFKNYEEFIVNDIKELNQKVKNINKFHYKQISEWNLIALKEKANALLQIKQILTN